MTGKKEICFLKTATKNWGVNEGLALCQFAFYLYLVCRCLFLHLYLLKIFIPHSDSVYATFITHFHHTEKYINYFWDYTHSNQYFLKKAILSYIEKSSFSIGKVYLPQIPQALLKNSFIITFPTVVQVSQHFATTFNFGSYFVSSWEVSELTLSIWGNPQGYQYSKPQQSSPLQHNSYE